MITACGGGSRDRMCIWIKLGMGWDEWKTGRTGNGEMEGNDTRAARWLEPCSSAGTVHPRTNVTQRCGLREGRQRREGQKHCASNVGVLGFWSSDGAAALPLRLCHRSALHKSHLAAGPAKHSSGIFVRGAERGPMGPKPVCSAQALQIRLRSSVPLCLPSRNLHVSFSHTLISPSPHPTSTPPRRPPPQHYTCNNSPSLPCSTPDET